MDWHVPNRSTRTLSFGTSVWLTALRGDLLQGAVAFQRARIEARDTGRHLISMAPPRPAVQRGLKNPQSRRTCDKGHSAVVHLIVSRCWAGLQQTQTTQSNSWIANGFRRVLERDDMKMPLIHLVSDLDKSSTPAAQRARARMAQQLSPGLSNAIRDEYATTEPAFSLARPDRSRS
jgi:hypothetical protein